MQNEVPRMSERYFGLMMNLLMKSDWSLWFGPLTGVGGGGTGVQPHPQKS